MIIQLEKNWFDCSLLSHITSRLQLYSWCQDRGPMILLPRTKQYLKFCSVVLKFYASSKLFHKTNQVFIPKPIACFGQPHKYKLKSKIKLVFLPTEETNVKPSTVLFHRHQLFEMFYWFQLQYLLACHQANCWNLWRFPNVKFANILFKRKVGCVGNCKIFCSLSQL